MRKAILAAVALLASTSASYAIDIPTNANGLPVLNVCTGTSGGGYFTSADTLKTAAAAYAELNIVETPGGIANLEMVDGSRRTNTPCHILIYQKDSVIAVRDDMPGIDTKLTPIRSLYPEFAQLLVKEGSGLDNLDDFVGTGKKIGGCQRLWGAGHAALDG